MWTHNQNWTIRPVIRLAASLLLLAPGAMVAQHVRQEPCATGRVRCFLRADGSSISAGDDAEHIGAIAGPLRIVAMEVRTLHGGPLAHHWLQLESSQGEVTIGFGPATIPFIDTGQISILDAEGNIERIGGVHLPFVDFNYSKPPNTGHVIGKPWSLTIAQADALVEKQRHRKFIGPYVPIFHDCHTWVCTVEASVNGKSTLPCYVLFKGYW